MVRPLAADAQIVFGKDYNKEFERIDKPEAKGLKKINQTISHILNRIYNLVVTHQFKTDAQFCALMSKEFKELSNKLSEEEKSLEHGGVDKLRPDLNTRESVQKFTWKVGEIVHRLQKEKGHSKEVDKFAKELDAFFEHNNEVMASDKKKIGAREGFVQDRGIDKEKIELGKRTGKEKEEDIEEVPYKEYVAGKVASSPIGHTPKFQKEIVGGVEKKQEADREFRARMDAGQAAGVQMVKGRPAIQKPLMALGNALPKLLFAQKEVVSKLSEKEQGQLKEIMEGKLHDLEPAELLGKAKQAIQLLNQAFFVTKEPVPKDVKKDLDRLRDHMRDIAKEMTPKPSREDRRTAMKDRGKELGAEMAGGVKRRDRLGAVQSLRASLPALVKELKTTKLADGTSFIDKALDDKQRRYLGGLTESSLAKVSEKGIVETTKRVLKICTDIVNQIPDPVSEKVGVLMDAIENMNDNLETLKAA